MPDYTSDLPAPGRPVRAPVDCQVLQTGWDSGGFGVHIRTRDSDGNYTILGHLSRALVTVGEQVSAGQVIGMSGRTGHSTGPHVPYMLPR